MTPWRALGCAIGLLPFAWLRGLGAILGWLAGSVLCIRRGHVDAAMRRAGLEPRAPEMYRALGASALEFLWLAGRPRELGDVVAMAKESSAAWDAANAKGRGVVVAASHTGNWDLTACAMAQRGPLLVVTKRLSMKGLDAFWQSTRAAYGVALCDPRGAFARARAELARGSAVAMMIDQVPAREHGLACELLGAPALVDRAPAALAARAGAPLVVAASRRTGDGRHAIDVLAVLEPPPRAGRAWVDEATRAANRALEAFVRAHPSEWLWLHRRWKGGLASGLQAPGSRLQSSTPRSRSSASPDRTSSNVADRVAIRASRLTHRAWRPEDCA